jgi:multiple sugar transport system substrate-binding protein
MKAARIFISFLLLCMLLSACATPAATPAAEVSQPEQPTEAVQVEPPTEVPPIEEPAETEQPAATEPTAEFDWRQFEGTEIRVLLNQDNWTKRIEPYFGEFEELTGIKLIAETYPEDQYRQKLSIELTSGVGNIDIFESSPPQEGLKYSQAGWYEDLAEYPQNAAITSPDYHFDDFMPGSLNLMTVEGQLIGIPTLIETEMLFYRKDLFEQAGLSAPKTLDELLAAAEQLNDPENDFYGITGRGKAAAAVTQFSSFLYNFGGDWLDANREPTINSPEAVQALQFYGDMLRKYGPPGSVNYHWAEVLALFQQGKASMFYEGSGFYSPVEDPEQSTVVGKVGYLPFPAGPAGEYFMLTGWGVSMAKSSQNKEAAWYFIQWSTSPEMNKRLQVEAKVPSSRNSTWEDPEGKAAFPQEWIDAYIYSTERATKPDRPPVLAVAEVRDAIGNAIVLAIEGEDVQVAADQAAVEMKDIMASTEPQ